MPALGPPTPAETAPKREDVLTASTTAKLEAAMEATAKSLTKTSYLEGSGSERVD